LKRSKYKLSYYDINELSRAVYENENNEDTYEVTLTSGTTATSVSNQFVGTSSVIVMMPTSSSASTEDYYIATTAESFTIYHSNTGAGDRTFRYFVFG
jgi:hypothetical protein